MAITMAVLGSSNTTTAASEYSTTSYTPTANRLVIAAVINSKAGTVNTPTFSGNGLTWVSIATQSSKASTLRATMFRAMGASVSAGTGLIFFAGTNQTGCSSSVYEFASVDTTGTNGSGAVVQNVAGTGTGGTSLSLTLNNFGDATNNGATAMWVIQQNEAMTNEAGWTEIHDMNYNVPGTAIETEWISGQDTTPSVSWTTATTSCGIAIEIKAAAVVSEADLSFCSAMM